MTAQILIAIGAESLVGLTLGLVVGGGSILATPPLLLYAVGIGQPHVAIGTGALAVSVNANTNLIGHARKEPCSLDLRDRLRADRLRGSFDRLVTG